MASWPRDQFRVVFEAARDAAGFRHNSAVAEAAGINTSTVSNWFNPKKSVRPTPDTLTAVAGVLQISPLRLWEAAGLLEPGALQAAETERLERKVEALEERLTAVAAAPALQWPGPDPDHRCGSCGQALPSEAARWLTQIHDRLDSDAVTWQELYDALGVEGDYLRHLLAGAVPIDRATAERLLAAGIGS